jgi:hypothetical protein
MREVLASALRDILFRFMVISILEEQRGEKGGRGS